MGREEIIGQLMESVRIYQALSEMRLVEEIERAAEVLANGIDKEPCHVFLFGVGGCAAIAEHISHELKGYFYPHRDVYVQPLTEILLITRIINDEDYREIFSKQIEVSGTAGDIAIALSTSGNSRTVIKAAEVAKGKDLTVIAFTGQNGGELANIEGLDHVIRFPSTETVRLEEAFLTAGHIICQQVQQRLSRK